MNEGYLLLATGPAAYLEMARNLAASLKVMDGSRRVCLIHDLNAGLRSDDPNFFDDFAVLPHDDRFGGLMDKIRLYPISPFDVTMVIDVDCLLSKRDIDQYWEEARRTSFLIAGEKRTCGEWKGVDVANLLTQEGAPYLIEMNSGVFSFQRSNDAKAFFEGLVSFYLRRCIYLKVARHRNKLAQVDEVYFGLWMGLSGMQGWTRKGRADSWMVSTWRAVHLHLDPERGYAVLRKPRHSFAGIPHPLGGWDRLSPTLVHFIGLKPRHLYRRAAAYYRSRVSAAHPTSDIDAVHDGTRTVTAGLGPL